MLQPNNIKVDEQRWEKLRNSHHKLLAPAGLNKIRGTVSAVVPLLSCTKSIGENGALAAPSVPLSDGAISERTPATVGSRKRSCTPSICSKSPKRQCAALKRKMSNIKLRLRGRMYLLHPWSPYCTGSTLSFSVKRRRQQFALYLSIGAERDLSYRHQVLRHHVISEL